MMNKTPMRGSPKRPRGWLTLRMDRTYEASYKSTCGVQHKGPWVDAGKGAIKRKRGRSASVSWKGTTSEGVEYAVSLAVDLDKESVVMVSQRMKCQKK
jgi:hypothetical protein